MAYNEETARRISKLLKRKKNFTEKKMFGGLAFLYQGNMCVGVSSKDYLIVRAGLENYQSLKQLKPHAADFEMKGKSLRGWLMIYPEGYEQEDDLKFWVECAVDFVKTLPPKE